ncbi:MAG: tetratricopeptide repeat protein [Chloroflexi bacterium]|nr:tetratricopeptide repeat protein [Chloroflexota bacterium]
MMSLRKHPALKIGLAFLIVLLLNIQPNWKPLQDDWRVLRGSTSFTGDSYRAISDAYARQPWNADWAQSAGFAALAVGDYAAAQTALQKTASLKGWTPELHIALGDAYQGQGLSDQAVTEWETALPDHLTDTALLTKLARVYENKGRYPEAAAVLRTLVALEPDNAFAQYRFGVVLSVIDPPSAPAHLALAAGLDESVQPFAESLSQAVAAGLDADDPAYMAGVIGYTLIGLQEYPLAKASLLNAVSDRPDFAEAHAYLGLAEDRLGGDGLDSYERALALDDTLPLAHYLLGLHHRRKGDNDAAIAELKRAFDLDPANAAAAAELGSAYAELNNLQEAESWYIQAVNVASEDANFWVLLSQFYLDHEIRIEDAALATAQKAYELAPNLAEANDALGYAYYLNGSFKFAEEFLLKAQSLDGRSARINFHLGLMYLDTNRPDEARQALNAAASLDAGGPIAEAAIRALTTRLGGPSPTP